MRISDNDFYTNVKKACIAIGIPRGFSEDAARSVYYAFEQGINYLENLLFALNSFSQNSSSIYETEQALKGTFVSARNNFPLSSVYAAPLAGELAVLNKNKIGKYSKNETIQLLNVDFPSIVIYEILRLSKYVDNKHGFEWSLNNGEEIKGQCCGGRIILIKGTYNNILSKRNCLIIVKNIRYTNISEIPERLDKPFKGINVNSTTWNKITEYSNRLLVESSDDSRLKGAGAGVIDRD